MVDAENNDEDDDVVLGADGYEFFGGDDFDFDESDSEAEDEKYCMSDAEYDGGTKVERETI